MKLLQISSTQLIAALVLRGDGLFRRNLLKGQGGSAAYSKRAKCRKKGRGPLIIYTNNFVHAQHDTASTAAAHQFIRPPRRGWGIFSFGGCVIVCQCRFLRRSPSVSAVVVCRLYLCLLACFRDHDKGSPSTHNNSRILGRIQSRVSCFGLSDMLFPGVFFHSGRFGFTHTN